MCVLRRGRGGLLRRGRRLQAVVSSVGVWVTAAGGLTESVPLVCVVRVLCSRAAAVLLHSAAFSEASSYCWRRVMFSLQR